MKWREGESNKTGSEEKRENMAAYVEWLLTPTEEREPSTKTAFAEHLGVSPQTLRNYDREPFVQREMTERARAGFKHLALTEVLSHMAKIAVGEVEGATAANAVSAGKVLLDWVEKTSDIRTQDLDLSDLTEEDLVGLALDILQGASNDD